MALFLFVKPIIPVFEYIVNYDFIVKELCENKAKPELACNGKCHLMKELAKANDSDNPLSTDKKETSKQPIEVLFLEKFPVDFQLFSFKEIKKFNSFYSNLYQNTTTFSTFHPPTV
ncbi:hypothetical protein H9X57_02935 [Flavobacterium piscinae]|uniref:Uncharacterized protein n=1 Tax=Flavobacterium piscinae TaxID=2506424 RepID=A0A4V1N4H6_9FLAO|nr:hypothetical protein [Flavobacterium piscinae]MBC8882724.1 hypothetical protein [Flavobacterium piscinae]RXR32196.1 hypothetical protein EQG68_08105 [Flavobacterium piscinae]